MIFIYLTILLPVLVNPYLEQYSTTIIVIIMITIVIITVVAAPIRKDEQTAKAHWAEAAGGRRMPNRQNIAILL